MKHLIQVQLLLGSALLFTGCASYKGGAVDYRTANQFRNTQTAESVHIGAEAMTDAAKVKQVFYVDVTSKSYFPVEIAIDNTGESKVLLEKDLIELHLSGGGIIHPVNVSVMTDEFEHNKIAYALLGFGIFSYMSADDANKKMAADWASKELPKEVIVGPGRKSSGFIYLKLPNGERPIGLEMVVPFEYLDKQGTQTVHLRL